MDCSSTTTMGTARPSQNKSGSYHDWRRYGESRRQILVEQDEANTSFYLNPSCPIARYFELAERVVNQFRIQCEECLGSSPPSCSSLEDTYIMGHRLIAFLSLALPHHPGYLSVTVSADRNKTFRDLVWINERMDEVALKIDEEQLNRFISLEFDPDPGDPEEEEEEGEDFNDKFGLGVPATGRIDTHTTWNTEQLALEQQASWENFPSWNADNADVPNAADTDSSSFESELNSTLRDASDSERDDVAPRFLLSNLGPIETPGKKKKQVKFQLGEDEPTVDKSFIEVASGEELETAFRYHSDDGNQNGEHEDPPIVPQYELRETAHGKLQVSDFLRKIAEEDVRYENDSEANDSWAQDGEQFERVGSSDSAGSTLTCDPARIALREIMGSASHAPQSGESRGERQGAAFRGDPWAAFDFASVRQSVI